MSYGPEYRMGLETTTVAEVPQQVINQAIMGHEDYLMQHWQYRLDKKVNLFGPPLIFLIGTVGNLLSLFVLLRPRMRIKPTFLYLAGVSAADLIFLYINPLRRWLELVHDNNVIGENGWVCKAVCFLGGATSHYSVWLIVLVTAERFFFIFNPLKAPLVCKRGHALVAMGVLLGLVVVINMHQLFTYDIIRSYSAQGNISRCRELPEYAGFVIDVWPWIDLCIYSIVPFAAILTLNILIILNARGTGRMRRTMSSTSQTCVVHKESKHLTIMLLTLSFTFLLTTSPMTGFIIYYSQLDRSAVTYKMVAEVNLTKTLCLHFMWVNHAINFFLYCLVGKNFRQELTLLLRCQWSGGIRSRTSKATHLTDSVSKEAMQLQQVADKQ